jgi:hypothetical protein
MALSLEVASDISLLLEKISQNSSFNILETEEKRFHLMMLWILLRKSRRNMVMYARM